MIPLTPNRYGLLNETDQDMTFITYSNTTKAKNQKTYVHKTKKYDKAESSIFSTSLVLPKCLIK